MIRGIFQLHMVMILVLSGLVMWGCNRTEPESESPASPQVDADTSGETPTPPEMNAKAVNHSSVPEHVESFSSTPSFNRPTDSSIVSAPTSKAPKIGPGYFDGNRDDLVFSSPRIEYLKVSPDGRYAVVSRRVNEDGSQLQVWEIASGELIMERYEPLGTTEVTISPDSQAFAYGARDRTVVLQPLPEGPAKRWTKHRLNIEGLDFSPDGKLLASLGNDDQLLISDVSSGMVVSQVIDGGARFATEVRLVTPNRLWARGSNNKLRWYDFDGSSLVLSKEVDLPENTRIFASDGQKLYGQLPDRSLSVVTASEGKDSADRLVPFPASPQEETPKLSGILTAGAVSSVSKTFAFATADQTLKIWPKGDAEDEDEDEEVIKLTRTVSKLATDDAGRYWVAAMQTGELLVIDRNNVKTTRWLENYENDGSLAAPRISSNGNILVSMQGANEIVTKEIENGLVRSHFAVSGLEETPNKSTVTTVVADSNQVCCGTSGGMVQVWNEDSLASSTPISVSDSEITALAISPDGRQVLAGDNDGKTFWIHPGNTSPPVSRQEQQGTIRAAKYSPDGKWAVTASEDHSIVVWDVARHSKRHVLKEHAEAVQAVAFSPDSLWLISGDRLGQVILWDALLGQQMREVTLQHPLLPKHYSGSIPTLEKWPDAMPDQGVSSLAFNSDQSGLAVGTIRGYFQTYDLIHSRELSKVFMGGPVTDLKFAKDSSSLMASTIPGEVVRYWRKPKPPRMLSGHDGYVRFAALDESGMRAVTGGHDEQLCVWDVSSGELLQSLDHKEAISAGALSPDGRRAVTVGFGTGVIFWDLEQMQRLEKRYGHQGRIWALAFSPDGKTVASGCEDQTLKIWDFATQKTKLTIPHDNPVRFVKFSPDGTKLLTRI